MRATLQMGGKRNGRGWRFVGVVLLAPGSDLRGRPVQSGPGSPAASSYLWQALDIKSLAPVLFCCSSRLRTSPMEQVIEMSSHYRERPPLPVNEPTQNGAGSAPDCCFLLPPYRGRMGAFCLSIIIAVTVATSIIILLLLLLLDTARPLERFTDCVRTVATCRALLKSPSRQCERACPDSVSSRLLPSIIWPNGTLAFGIKTESCATCPPMLAPSVLRRSRRPFRAQLGSSPKSQMECQSSSLTYLNLRSS